MKLVRKKEGNRWLLGQWGVFTMSDQQLELFNVNIIEPEQTKLIEKPKRIRRTKAEIEATKNVTPVRQNNKLPNWLQLLGKKSFYYFIGVIDIGIGAVAMATFGHILIYQIPLAFFGAAITIGRVQAYRFGKGLKKPLFIVCWIVGMIVGSFTGVSLEIALVNAQHDSLTTQNGERIAIKSKITELEQLQLDLPRYERERSKAIENEQWNTRDQLTKSIESGRDRMKVLQSEIQTNHSMSISAKDFFGQLFGANTVEWCMRILFLLLHVFMEMVLALFAKPLNKKTV